MSRARPLDPLVSWAVFASFWVLIALSLLDHPQRYVAIGSALPIVAGAYGIIRNRPATAVAWWLMVGSGALFLGAWWIRGRISTFGDLTSDRPILPDVVGYPGYLMLIVSYFMLLRGRWKGPLLEVVTDGIGIAGTALLVVAATTPAVPGSIAVKFAVLSYPVTSTVVLAIAIALMLTVTGAARTSTLLLFLSALSLWVADLTYAFAELGRIDMVDSKAYLIYLFVPMFGTPAILHPTMRTVAGAVEPDLLNRRRLVRTVMMGVGLAVSVIAFGLAGENRGNVDWGIIVVLMTVTMWKLGHSLVFQARATETLTRQATHDELTGLPARPVLVEHLAHLESPGQKSAAVLSVDLDQFKYVNGTLGMQAGDMMLQQVAVRLRESMPNASVYRLRSDEFVIVQPDCTRHRVADAVDAIRAAFRSPFRIAGTLVHCTASIGHTLTVPNSRRHPEVPLQEAETAMHLAKRGGRGSANAYYAAMRDEISRRAALEQRMRIDLDDSTFDVAFQPIVSAETGQITCFEALARWTVDGEAVAPDEFIPIAEESGMIVELGALTLDKACAMITRWRSSTDHPDVEVAVNISSVQLKSGTLVDTVTKALERHGLPAQALWLEVTESAVVDDLVSHRQLNELADAGVRISVDDFGTGFSSLSSLRGLPVAKMKVDRSFVSMTIDGLPDVALVTAITAIAEALGLELVAEGVETIEQARLLTELGCRELQGFLFSRPVPPTEVPVLLYGENLYSPLLAQIR